VEKPANWLDLPCLHCWNQWSGQRREKQKLFELAPARRKGLAQTLSRSGKRMWDQVFQTSGDHLEANYTSQDESLSPNQIC